MDVDCVCREAKIIGHSDCKEVFASIDEALNQFLGGETIKLLQR